MKNMMKETRSERESLNKTLSCKFVYCYFINKLEVSAVDSQNNKKFLVIVKNLDMVIQHSRNIITCLKERKKSILAFDGRLNWKTII